jgi:hypothetical protein
VKRSSVVAGVVGLWVLGACATAEEARKQGPGSGGAAGVSGGDAGGAGGCVGHGASGGDGASGGCDDALKRCAHLFTYPAGAESSVEVRGDWEPTTWMTGVPMIKNGAQWEATIDVPWAVDVQYKFVLDGANWVNDPNNPSTISDGFGGFNSLLSGVTCDVGRVCPPRAPSTGATRCCTSCSSIASSTATPPTTGPIPGVALPAAYRGGDWAGVLKPRSTRATSPTSASTCCGSASRWTTRLRRALGDDGHQYSAYHGYWPRTWTVRGALSARSPSSRPVVDAAHAQDIKVILDYAMNHVHSSSPDLRPPPGLVLALDNGGELRVRTGLLLGRRRGQALLVPRLSARLQLHEPGGPRLLRRQRHPVDRRTRASTASASTPSSTSKTSGSSICARA